MKIFIDYDNSRFVQGTSGTAVRELEGMWKVDPYVDVYFITDKTTFMPLEAGAVGILGIRNGWQGNIVVYQAGWTAMATTPGGIPFYRFTPSYNTQELLDIFDGLDQASQNFFFEIEWNENGAVNAARAVSIEISNRVLRNSEAVTEIVLFGDLAYQNLADLNLGELATMDEADLGLGELATMNVADLSIPAVNNTTSSTSTTEAASANVAKTLFDSITALQAVVDALATTEHVAADIAARDLQAGSLITGDLIKVTNASDDPTVDSGWALYRKEAGGTFTKVQEQESLDLILAGGVERHEAVRLSQPNDVDPTPGYYWVKRFAHTGTLTRWTLTLNGWSGGAGSGDSISVQLYHNGSPVGLAVAISAGEPLFSAVSLSLAIAAGDLIEARVISASSTDGVEVGISWSEP